MSAKQTFTDGVFSVDSEHGFLPIADPIDELPDRYSELQSCLSSMPIRLDTSASGEEVFGKLNYPNEIQKAVHTLPNYIEEIKKENEPLLLAALFRSYAFLSSAYLLEPSFQEFKKTGEYGVGLSVLPENLAVPFDYVAQKLKVRPWMDYHYAYSLGNYVRKDKNSCLDWQNLKMANSFSGSSDEVGFIMVHVDINQCSPDLIASITDTLNSLDNSDANTLVSHLTRTWDTMKNINSRRKKMWAASNPKNYNDFRVFIMGIKGNDSIFPNGVTFEGVSSEPRYLRGQTGAQDDIIPTVDIFSGLIAYYPENDLTRYLMDLRDYRPEPIRRFFAYLTESCANIYSKIKNLNPDALIPLLGVIDEIYGFRDGHWQFVQKYIMANTKYARATGGTPITSWLPNQIQACLSYMSDILKEIEQKSLQTDFTNNMVKTLEYRQSKLDRQLAALSVESYDPNVVHSMNESDRDYD